MNRRTSRLLLLIILLLGTAPALAWNAKTHRLSAAIAYEQLDPARRETLIQILQHHPRFEQDFQIQMPAAIASADPDTRRRWLLGQAAVWPDLARQFPERDRLRHHRATWHYIDGRWMPPARFASGTLPPLQGNVYLNMSPLPDIDGELPVHREEDVQNMLQALDYNLRVLQNPRSAAERAVALCWVLHLVADIHQPLHAGALLSARLFAEGDRGGNEIPTTEGNLHARWDQALGRQSFNRLLPALQLIARGINSAEVTTDSPQWLLESRQILQTAVYRTDMRQAILQSEQSGSSLQPLRLDRDYLRQMQQISMQRVALAGLRMAELLGSIDPL